MMIKSWCVVAGVALGSGGCGVDEIGVESVASPLLPPPVEDCDPLVCPGNSDLLALLGPYELDEAGIQASSRGFRIASMSRYGQQVTSIEIAGASLRATLWNGVVLTGGGLIGLNLRLEYQGSQFYDLVIDDYLTSKVPFYAGGAPAIDGYHIVYNETGMHQTRELCPYAKVDAGVTSTWAVFWKGDRFEPETGRIFASNGRVGRWFNLSCAGEAPIKMLRARTGGAVAPGSPVAQRQATLNMFTASYCGPGKRYTELGQALEWSDLSGPSQMGQVSSFEAVWDEGGAVCLDVPRMVTKAEVECAIPACTKPEIDLWFLHGWLRSGNK